MDPRLVTAVIVVLGVPAVLVGYIWLTERVLGLLGQRARVGLRPWLWLAPALAFLAVFLVYPTIGTLVRSFQDKAGTKFVGLDNFAWFFNNDASLLALRNSLIWLVVLTGLTVGLGLLIAVLVDRVRYETVAKSVIFVPLAISMVAASVIWTFMYWRSTPPDPRSARSMPPSGPPGSRRSPGSRSPTSGSTASCSSS
jgi:alpha-glucoside transport system permease protein